MHLMVKKDHGGPVFRIRIWIHVGSGFNMVRGSVSGSGPDPGSIRSVDPYLDLDPVGTKLPTKVENIYKFYVLDVLF